jgi:hypothetical protein
VATTADSKAPAPERATSIAASLSEAAPVALVIVLLLLATWFSGAFALRHWAPVAVFVLVLLAVGVRPMRRRLELLPVIAFAAFALLTLLSALWSDSPQAAVEGGARTLLYAALLAAPVLLVRHAGSARRLGDLVVAGLGGVVVVTVITLLADPAGAFLAGRLDAPVDYRNGTAALFAMAFWGLCCVGASRDRSLLFRVPACTLAALALGLVFLTQSRGAVIGVIGGGVVALALGPERLRRAWLALLAVAGVALLSGPLLRPYNAFIDEGAASAADLSAAVDALLLLGAASAVVALLGGLFDRGLRATQGAMLVARRTAAVTLAVITLVGVAGGLAVVGDPFALAADKLAEFRSLEVAAPGETRLGSVGGQRYDLWRIAWDQFASAPIAGVGEGGYPVAYFQERRTDRNLTTPHSFPLRVLAETGTLGALALLGALAGAAAVLLRRRRATDHRTLRDASMLAAIAAVAFAQTTVDWLWLIPGIAGLALLCLGLALRTMAGDVAPRSAARSPQIAFATAAVLGAVLAGTLFLGDRVTRQARAADTPQQRLDRAQAAATLTPLAVAPLRLQAGALESMGRVEAARAKLREAIDKEPRIFVGYVLLGDLELRAGRAQVAEALYRRALELNPLDVGLAQLVELARRR